MTAKHLKAKIKDALEDVPNIDDDTIIRRYLNLIEASLRTNHFAPGTDTRAASSLAIKLDSRAVDGLPEPRPWREIFVYGPEVEGVHLRFGPVARGGLRWSDRAQDYRTEVLGLVKAQQVKNAVIVPVGAKGGFFPEAPAGGRQPRRDLRGRHARPMSTSSPACCRSPTISTATRSCRRKTWSAATATIPISWSPPTRARRPSPTRPTRSARSIGFWLDDAFASGGSAGYDHKKMGITAKRRLGGGEAAFPRDEPRHPDHALHRRRRRRHVGRRVRQRHAACRSRPG